MANQTVYPYGTGGTLPSSIGIINDVYTGGADKAASANTVKELNEQINEISEIALSDYSAIEAFITNSNEWVSGNSNNKCKFIPVVAGEKYVVTAQSGSYAAIALLVNDSHTDGDTPSYSSGTARQNISAGNKKIVIIPDDTKYLYVAVLADSTDITPDSVLRVVSRIDSIDFDAIMPYFLNISEYSQVRAYPANTGKWVTDSSSYPYYGVFIPCNPGQSFDLASTTIVRYCFLKSNSHVKGEDVDYASGYSGNPVATNSGGGTVTAPADASYLYIVSSMSGDGRDLLPLQIRTTANTVEDIVSTTASGLIEYDAAYRIVKSNGNTLRKLNYTLDEYGYEVPETLQVLNVLRKAAQYAEIRWIPKANVPKSKGNNFLPGTTYTGLLYSTCKEIDKQVGIDVSLHTFMTAVNNPYSLLYTEIVSESLSKSAWGKTYHGRGSVAAYFGTVCTVLSAMCTGYDYDFISTEYAWLDKTFRALKIYDQSAQGLQLGDILWKPGHCRVVTGLKRSVDGIVLRVAFTESVEELARVVDETADEFNARLSSESGIIYRPLELYKNIDYVPSPYVPVFGEQEQEITYNDDICTFAGDKACFREGELVVLNYNLTDSPTYTWTAIEVYKDDALVGTYAISEIDQSELPESQQNHALKLGTSLTYGMYKARMTDGEHYSNYTFWEVLKTNVSFKQNGNIVNVGFSTTFGKATVCRLGLQTGSVYAQYQLTEEEAANGRAAIDFVKLNKEQGFVTVIKKPSVLLKVFFVGDYGRVTNEPLPIYFE